MNLSVILSPAEDREFVEAAAWYQPQAGRGDVFIQRLQEAADRIGEMPELPPNSDG